MSGYREGLTSSAGRMRPPQADNGGVNENEQDAPPPEVGYLGP